MIKITQFLKAGPWCHLSRFQNCWNIDVTLKASCPVSWEVEKSGDSNVPVFSSLETHNPCMTWHPMPPLFYSTLLLLYSQINIVTSVLGECHIILITLHRCVVLVLKKHYWSTLMRCSTANTVFLWNLQFSSTSWLSSDLSRVTQLSINIDFWI